MQELLLLWPKIVSLKHFKLIQSWPKIHYCIFDFHSKDGKEIVVEMHQTKRVRFRVVNRKKKFQTI